MASSAGTFDAETHTYAVDGVVWPSTTQVITAAGLNDSTHYTDEARLRGTYVHQAVAMMHTDDLDEASLDPVLVPYVAAARAFLSAVGGVVAVAERPYFHPALRYAGTPDALLATPQGYLLIDWKSGGPEPWHAVQTAAYLDLLVASGEWPDVHARTPRAAVYLADDGTYRVVTHTDRTDLAVFRAALTVAQWKAAHR